tara:strand:- start:212 stop:3283 length:3072 start_codon:yes stop_codon:yes gene_type:complete
MANRAEQEKEYQDILKVSKSLLGDITEMIDKNERKTKGMSDTQRSYNALLRDRINEAGEYEDIESTIAQLTKDNQSYNATVNKQLKDKRRTENGSLKTIKATQAKQNEIFKTAVATLQAEEKYGSAIQTVDASAQDLANTLSGSIDGFMSSVGNIPVVGGMLNSIASGPAENLKGALGGAAQDFTTSFGKSMKAGKGGLASLASAGSAGMSSLAAAINPVGLAILAVVAIIGAGLMAFKKLEDAAKAFRNETGLLRSQTDGLDTSIMKSYKSTVALGASMEDVSKAAAEFTNQFEGLVQPSAEVLTSVVALNKNMGITTANAVGANEVFQNMAGLSAEQAQYQVQQVALASELAGVAPNKVMADIANSAEVAATYFQGSVGNLTKAAIQAAKMGTSLKQAADVSDNLLDFESSITNELTASAMLGKSINFNKARELAAQGNIVGAQQSVLDTLEKTVDLNNVNKFQLDAIAKASGMPVAEIQKQLNLRKQFGKLDADQMKAAEELLASGKELSDISDEDLKKQTESVIANQQMQSEFDKMANQLSAIGSEILMTFMPVGKMIMGLLSPIMKLIKGFFAPIGNALQGVMDAFKPIQDMMSDIFGQGAGIGAVFETIGTILSGGITFAINLLTNNLKLVFGIVSGIFDVFKGIFTGDFSLIGDGLMSIGEGILRFFYSIPVVLYETIIDMFPSIGSFFSNLFSGVGDSVGGIFSSIADSIGNFFAPVGDLFMKIGKILTLPARILLAGLQAVGRIIMDNIVNPMIAFGKSLIAPIVEGFNMLSSFIMGTIVDPIVEFFGMLLNPLIEGFNYIGSIVQQYIVDPIMGAIDFLAGLNPFSWFSDDEEVPDPEVASTDVTSTMGTAGEQSLEAEQLKVAGSIDDGIVQNGNIISTDPEDTLIATKTPSELIPQAPDITKPVVQEKSNLFGDGFMGKMIGMTPIGMAANAVNDAGGIEAAIGGIGDFVGGLFGGGDESESSSNKELLAKMDVLIQAVRQSGNISMDGKAVTDGIQQVVEKKTSNSFGLV